MFLLSMKNINPLLLKPITLIRKKNRRKILGANFESFKDQEIEFDQEESEDEQEVFVRPVSPQRRNSKYFKVLKNDKII